MAGSTTSDAFYKEQMDFLLLNTSAPLSGITSFWVGLLTTGSSQSSALQQAYVEVPSGVGYARVRMNRSNTNTGGFAGWQYNSGNLEYSNAQDIVYGVPSGTWGTVVAIGLFKSSPSNSSDLMYYAGLTSTKTVNNGDGAPKILAGQLRIARAVC